MTGSAGERGAVVGEEMDTVLFSDGSERCRSKGRAKGGRWSIVEEVV